MFQKCSFLSGKSVSSLTWILCTELLWCRPRRPEKGLSIILPDLLFISLHIESVQNKVPLGCPNYPAMPWDTFENMEIHPFVNHKGGI